MRAYVPEYDLVAPTNLRDALALIGDQRRPIAGGTDLMVLFEGGKLPYRRLVSLHGITELCGITADPSYVTIGALATYTEIQQHEIIRREFPLLVRAASWTGAVATQNRGTLAGNIANASPAADSPPALLVYDAELELMSSRGQRWIPYASFHTGYKTSIMPPDEMIAHIRCPVRLGLHPISAQGRNAPRSSHFKSRSSRPREGGCWEDRAHPNRAGKRRACPPALS